MAFRRQDIPKTTRRASDGRRRLYPRFLRDSTMLPRVGSMIDYLDQMVGRRRGDLSQDAALDVIGDTKLARCLLSCVSDTYRYRTPDLSEIIGRERAARLADWRLDEPVHLRQHTYLAANEQHLGVISLADRVRFLTDIGEPLGLSGEELSGALVLDAEANQMLVRIGPQPDAQSVIARYNALLLTSVLRHSGVIDFDKLDLSVPRTLVDALMSRYEVPVRRHNGGVRLKNRKNAQGVWSTFGSRVARVAAHLLMASDPSPTGSATIHLSGATSTLLLDERGTFGVRPNVRAVADVGGVIWTAKLLEAVAAHRRSGGSLDGWTVRRGLEPVAVDGAVILPEVVFIRGDVSIPALPIPTKTHQDRALAAVRAVADTRPLLALNWTDGAAGVVGLSTPDPSALVGQLEGIAQGAAAPLNAIDLAVREFHDRGWLRSTRLDELGGVSGGSNTLRKRLLDTEQAVEIAEVGVCHVEVLRRLRNTLAEPASGRWDIPALRSAAVEALGDPSAADALTLALLSEDQPPAWAA